MYIQLFSVDNSPGNWANKRYKRYVNQLIEAERRGAEYIRKERYVYYRQQQYKRWQHRKNKRFIVKKMYFENTVLLRFAFENVYKLS